MAGPIDVEEFVIALTAHTDICVGGQFEAGGSCPETRVDLQARTLAVRVQRVQIGYDVEEGAPKTEASPG